MNRYDFFEELKKEIADAEDKELAASGFMKRHGFDISADDVVVLSDNTPVIKDDPDGNYDTEDLEVLKNEVSIQLSLFPDSELGYGDTTDSGATNKGTRKYVNRLLRDGISSYYSEENGWNGKEDNPWTIKGAWDSFGFVDFLGMRISNARDVAQMFSIYRNPKLEYFHIVLAKDGRIVHQLAMSSGLSCAAPIFPQGGMEQLRDDLSDIDYDEAYLVHNHPSGNPEPSKADVYSTALLQQELFQDKLKGHVILDHTEFTLLRIRNMYRDEDGHFKVSASQGRQHYEPHDIGTQNRLFQIRSGSDIFAFIRMLHEDGTFVLSLDNSYCVEDIMPFAIEDYDKDSFISDMKESFCRDRIIATTRKEDMAKFRDILRNAGEEGRKQPLLDFVYVDCSLGFYKSFRTDGEFTHYNWQEAYLKKSGYAWNENIADHPKQQYLFPEHMEQKNMNIGRKKRRR